MSDDISTPAHIGSTKRVGRGPASRFRASPRSEPVREAARTPEGEKRLQRNRKRAEDRFFIDPKIVAEAKARGVSLEWKRESSYGKADVNHMMNLQDNHWSPVQAGHYPGLVVKQDGMILMERPLYLTQEARQEDYQIATDQVRGVGAKITETPDGTMTRDHPSVRANTRINRSYEPMTIPEE